MAFILHYTTLHYITEHDITLHYIADIYIYTHTHTYTHIHTHIHIYICPNYSDVTRRHREIRPNLLK